VKGILLNVAVYLAFAGVGVAGYYGFWEGMLIALPVFYMGAKVDRESIVEGFIGALLFLAPTYGIGALVEAMQP